MRKIEMHCHYFSLKTYRPCLGRFDGKKIDLNVEFNIFLWLRKL